MASRIITKKGSGAPLASDLVHGELAVDTVNKRLYTENAGGTVIEVGTSPSTIDINAGTIDGTVIGGSSAAAGTFTTVTADGLTVNASQATISNDGSNYLLVERTTAGTEGRLFMGVTSSKNQIVSYSGTSGTAGKDLTIEQGNAIGKAVTVHANNDISFYEDTGTTAKFFWDASAESLGIGTTSPARQLTMSATTPIFQMTTPTLGTASDNGFEMYYLADANLVLNNRENGYTSFFTNANERMRIDSSGNLLVGKTAPSFGNSTANDGFLVHPNGSFHSQTDGVVNLAFNRRTTEGGVIVFYYNTSLVGSVSVTASATSYNTSSDERLKENITDANDAGDKIDAIKVRQYDWKVDGSHQDYGMVAQELMTVAPEAVHQPENPDDMMGVDYSKLVPMMLKEIQSLRARVAQLEGAN